MVVSPDGDENGPWAQTVNTYTWVLEQKLAADEQRKRERVPSIGRTASVEMRVFEPEWNARGSVPEHDTQRYWDEKDRKSTRLNSSHSGESRMPSSA